MRDRAERAAAKLDHWSEEKRIPWPQPQALPEPGAPLTLSKEWLPEAVAAWAWDTADRAAAPIEFAAVPLIVALGAVLGRRVALAPKAHDDWSEFANLWAAIIGAPGSMKSPMANAALAFPRRLESAKEDEWTRSERPRIEERIARFEAKVSVGERVLRKGEGSPAEVAEARRGLTAAEAELRAGAPRLTTSDATVEKLGELLANNPRGLLLTRDELAGWLRTLDRESRSGEREAWLELWSGKEPLRVDRIGRGSISIPPSCVSMVGGIQPGKLRRYVEEAASGGSGADGLLQRFGLLVWPELPEFELIDREPDHEAEQRLTRIFQSLDRPGVAELIGGPFVSFVSPSVGGDTKPVVLRFDPEAQRLATDWLEENGRRARLEGRDGSEVLAAWLAKRAKTFVALSLIFHAVEVLDGPVSSGPVSIRAARWAAAWCDLLETHVRKVYGQHADPQQARAAALANKILCHAVCDGVTLRDVYRHRWSHLATPEAVHQAIETLADLGWCRLEDLSTGGRPSLVVRINPKVLER